MKKKLILKICAVVLVLCAVISLPINAFAASDVQIKCTVTSQTETAVTVDVSVTSNVGFMYLELSKDFPSELTLTSITNGSLISDLTKGTKYIWIADEDVTATGTLCTLEFAIPNGTPSGDYPISFGVQLCGNYDEEEVDVTVIPCTVSIGTTEEPDMPTADASVCSYQVTKGENGEFSIRMISGLNSLNYSRFSYDITITTKDAEGNNETMTVSGTDQKVYTSLYGGNTAYSVKEHFGYEYAALATVTGLALESEYVKLEVQAYVISDGEKLYGDGAVLTFTGTTDGNGYPAFSFETE